MTEATELQADRGGRIKPFSPVTLQSYLLSLMLLSCFSSGGSCQRCSRSPAAGESAVKAFRWELNHDVVHVLPQLGCDGDWLREWQEIQWLESQQELKQQDSPS